MKKNKNPNKSSFFIINIFLEKGCKKPVRNLSCLLHLLGTILKVTSSIIFANISLVIEFLLNKVGNGMLLCKYYV